MKIIYSENMKAIDDLAKLYKKKARLLIPTHEDYLQAGKILAKMQDEKGYELKKCYWLISDVLIALSARRIGATVIIQNKKDFEAITILR